MQTSEEKAVVAGGQSAQIAIPEVELRRLLELLELAARRGAFELEEFVAIGSTYRAVVQCLKLKSS